MQNLAPLNPEDLKSAREKIAGANDVVVKIGSNVLVGGGETGHINRRVFCHLVETLAELAMLPHRRIILVTSGAIAVGRSMMGKEWVRRKQEALAVKQALAAVGQPYLMHLYASEFEFYGARVAQVLLTRDDMGNRERFLNARATLRALAAMPGVLPIVNENDTVANEEIRFGDNDTLAALVTTVIGAEALVILSDVGAMYDGDPTTVQSAKRVDAAYADDPALTAICGPAISDGVGTGGMASKLQAARMAASYGVPTVVAGGRDPDVLGRILSGDTVGTLLVPRSGRLGARKAWIRFGSMASGVISIDEGAEVAIRTRGRSLLPSGVVGVTGEFSPGSPVSIQGASGAEVARGLVGYSSADLRKIAGRRSDEFLMLLGFTNGDVAIHRDDLVLVEELASHEDA